MKVEHYSTLAERGIHPEVASISNGIKLSGSGFWIVAVVLVRFPETSGLGNLATGLWFPSKQQKPLMVMEWSL